MDQYFGFCYECEEYRIGVKPSHDDKAISPGFQCEECGLPFDDVIELHKKAIVDFGDEIYLDMKGG